MSDALDNIDEATERLFDALEDLQTVRGRREALAELDADEVMDDLLEENPRLADVWEPSDAPQLRMVLTHIDAARELVETELERTTPASANDERG